MATALPNTTNMLKLVTVAPVLENAFSSSPESAQKGIFWVIKFITIALGGPVDASCVVSLSFGGTIVWQVQLAKDLFFPFHENFGAGLYTGVTNEDFTIDVGFHGASKIGLSYGYF